MQRGESRPGDRRAGALERNRADRALLLRLAQARSLGGLTGAAYNLPDKTQVEVIVEGPKSAIEELVAWCWKGPEGAAEVGIKDRLTKKRNVTKVEVTWEFEDQEGRSREFETFENGGKKP